MSSNKLLTFCCLGYNHAKFLEDNIKSIWRSNYKNIEIIAIDDGSSDDSVKILKKLQKQSPCPMTVISQKNTGNVGLNFNRAFKKAKGQFVTFISLDDQYVDGAIDKAMSYLIKDKNLDFVASSVMSNFLEKDKTKIIKNWYLPTYKKKDLTVDDLLEYEYNEFGGFFLQGMFIRKEVVEGAKGFDEEQTGDDLVIRTRIFNYLKTKPRCKFKILDEAFILYRNHDNNIHFNHLRQFKIVTEYLSKYWSDRPNPKLINAFFSNVIEYTTIDKAAEALCMNSSSKKVIEDLINNARANIIIKIPILLEIKKIRFQKKREILFKILGIKFNHIYYKK